MASEPIELLASEAEAARARVAATIDDLQERINPRRIVGDAVDRATGNSLQALGVVREAAGAHPLAIGAAVAAIALALLARNRLAKAKINLGDNYRAYTDYDDGYDAAQTSAASHDNHRADMTAPVAALAARASESIETRPIVSIIMGIAAGAAIGALFPATDAERRLLRETSGKLGAVARGAARRAVDEFDITALGVGKVRASQASSEAAAQSAHDDFKG